MSGAIGNQRERTQGEVQSQHVAVRQQIIERKMHDIVVGWLYMIDGGFHFTERYPLHGVTPLSRSRMIAKNYQ